MVSVSPAVRFTPGRFISLPFIQIFTFVIVIPDAFRKLMSSTPGAVPPTSMAAVPLLALWIVAVTGVMLSQNGVP